MEYKIQTICESLHIGKATVYKYMEKMKKSISADQIRDNEYFYYTSSNRLFFKEKGFNFIKSLAENPTVKDTVRQNSTNSNNDIVLYQEKLIRSYEQRISFLEEENKKLLDIISLRDKTELAKNIEPLKVSSGEEQDGVFFWRKFFHKFKK